MITSSFGLGAVASQDAPTMKTKNPKKWWR